MSLSVVINHCSCESQDSSQTGICLQCGCHVHIPVKNKCKCRKMLLTEYLHSVLSGRKGVLHLLRGSSDTSGLAQGLVFPKERHSFGRWGLKPGSRAKLGEAWDVNLSNSHTNSTQRWNYRAGVVLPAANAAWRQERAQGSSLTMWVKSGSTAYQLKGEGGEEEDLRISSHDKWFFSVFFVISAS